MRIVHSENRDTATSAWIRADGGEAICFTVPRPPVPKERGRAFVSKGKVRVRTAERTVEYEGTIRGHAHAARLTFDAARPRGHRAWPMHAEAYEVTIRVYREPKARGDADNYVKAILDGCQGALYANDCRVTRGAWEIHVDAERPRVEVEITARGEDKPPRRRMPGCGVRSTHGPAGASGAARGPAGSQPGARAAR